MSEQKETPQKTATLAGWKKAKRHTITPAPWWKSRFLTFRTW
jgi:hypothetical protein